MQAKERNSISATGIQEMLEQIKGITSARVIMDDREGIAEIHLVGLPSRRPKQIVRDTESLLHARFGLDVDYRKISIVQLETEEQASSANRLRLVTVTYDSDPQPRAEVRLLAGTSYHVGTAQPASSEGAEIGLTAVAQATANAVGQATHDLVYLRDERAMTLPMGPRWIALVGMLASTAAESEFLTGTCVVRGSVPEAVARATLDALNRRLCIWSQQPELVC